MINYIYNYMLNNNNFYKYLDFIDIIYWINLDRSNDRKKKYGRIIK